MKKKLDQFLKSLIEQLTDFDINYITDNTTMDELNLVSLDFVTIKVEAKNQLAIDIDLNALAEANIETYGQLVDYLDQTYSK